MRSLSMHHEQSTSLNMKAPNKLSLNHLQTNETTVQSFREHQGGDAASSAEFQLGTLTNTRLDQRKATNVHSQADFTQMIATSNQSEVSVSPDPFAVRRGRRLLNGTHFREETTISNANFLHHTTYQRKLTSQRQLRQRPQSGVIQLR